MLARLIKAREENEEGFTLIELLVVIIIIGILAAIAIPVFLSQRKKGYDSAAKSDLRNMATAEESYLTDYDVYLSDANVAAAVANGSCPSGVTLASQCLIQIEGAKKSSNVGDIVIATDSPTNSSDGYCMGIKSRSGNNFWYDSEAGGLQNIASNLQPTTAGGACIGSTVTLTPAGP
jgi:type IV pilus assembly protein PilA